MIIELLPFKKNVFFTVYMTPMLLLLSGSYSIDGICVGFVGLFIAYCLRLYKNNDKIKSKQIIILTGLFILSLFAKEMSYICICLLLLLLPLKKIIKENKKTMLVATIIVAIVGMILATTILLGSDTISDPRSEGTNAKEQIEFLIKNPMSAVLIIINHIRDSLLNFDWLIYLCQVDFFGKASCIFVLQVAFILYVSISDNSVKFNLKEKTILLATFFGAYLTGSLMLYISFTKVGKLSINGYQPRYMFPILPLLFMVINNDNKKTDKEQREKISTVLAIFIMIGLVGSISRL